MLTQKDLQQIAKKGISEEKINEQLGYFKKGFPLLDVTRAATPKSGIKVLSPSETDAYSKFFEQKKSSLDIVKFVPASGAATRMFKSLFEFLESNKMQKDVEEVVKNIQKFAFYNELKEKVSQEGHSIEKLIKAEAYKEVVEFIITAKGLNYGSLPKGLIRFHAYNEASRTSFEEHLVEGVRYAIGKGNKVNIHFTVSPEHRANFEKLYLSLKSNYEKEYNIKLEVSFSEQKPETDTIAVDHDNNPFREKDGSLLFRPGGHGALLENLSEIDGDVIFIKNIDNVVPDSLKEPTIRYKKALAGLLLTLQEKINGYIKLLEANTTSSLPEIVGFIESQLGYTFSKSFKSEPLAKQVEKVISVLHRPLRVCGMVKNQGEPGGGPFWVEGYDGSHSLQILESSQFDFKIPDHKLIFEQATHFNPVDLVCSTRDHNGMSFELHSYRDPLTGFISKKSKDGKELKALELPGLWNGSMANWNTVFVEVPIETFNPVKTINDLLRPQHQ